MSERATSPPSEAARTPNDQGVLWQDVRTMLWKERRGLFRTRERALRAVAVYLTPVLFFGVFFPWQAGEEWFTRADTTIAAVFIPLVVSLISAPDSFAGERERRTLPTLLASRLSDHSILLGKIMFCVSLSMATTLAVLTLGAIVSNVTTGDGFMFYTAKRLSISLGTALLLSLFATGIAIPVSLRAKTAQEASQLLMVALMVPGVIAGPLLMFLSESNPESAIVTWVQNADWPTIGYGLLGFFLIADIALLWFATKRFRRGRLIT